METKSTVKVQKENIGEHNIISIVKGLSEYAIKSETKRTNSIDLII